MSCMFTSEAFSKKKKKPLVIFSCLRHELCFFFCFGRHFFGLVRIQNWLPGSGCSRRHGAFHPIYQHHVCDDASYHGHAQLVAPVVPQTLEYLLPVLGLHV